MDRGDGAYLFDVDGQKFLDLNNNFTTLIHGHAFPPVVRAVSEQLKSGSCFANPSRFEARLAELLCDRVPAVSMVRFVNTGTEAVMFAIKAARAFTGRSAIAKIEGSFHGAYDWAEVSQGGSPADWGPPESPHSTPAYRGMPQSVLSETLVLRFNQPEEARRLIGEHAHRLAAILIDPMPSRAGLIPPDPEFIAVLQVACGEHGLVLISDEVLNLRQSFNGAAARYGLEPDLVVMGKIIGGGLPIGAIGGRRDVMGVFGDKHGRAILPQSGTFSANPLSVVAGIAAMDALDKAAFDRLERLGERVRSGLRKAIAENKVPFCVTGTASLFRIHPRANEPHEYRDAYLTEYDIATMREMTRHLARKGVLMPPMAAASLSTPMQENECDAIVNAVDTFLRLFYNQQ
ncbi:aspartate aminotransferase family protein [Mesorhizobium sp. M0317]|uniref:aspartate aminotransferase family protein n=1 Tax=Mesorhizobium sp. M0317 TaxID=2956935 RepID=UPI00333B5280